MLDLVRRCVVLGSVVLLLAGCSPSGSTVVKPTTSTMSSPSVDATSVRTIEVGASGLNLLNAAGDSTEALGWFDDSAHIIAALTSSLGSAPTQVPYPGAIESAPGTDYTWGGFVLRVQDFPPTPPQDSNLTVLSTSSRVGSVDIRLANGLTVGSTLAEIMARGPVTSYPYTEPANHTAYQFDPVKIDTAEDGTVLLNYVNVIGDSVGVIQILAPTKNYGV